MSVVFKNFRGDLLPAGTGKSSYFKELFEIFKVEKSPVYTINELKEEKNLTLKDLEKIVGVNYTILSKISKGNQPLTEDIKDKFSQAFPGICIVAKTKDEIISDLQSENSDLRFRVSQLEEIISSGFAKAFPGK